MRCDGVCQLWLCTKLSRTEFKGRRHLCSVCQRHSICQRGNLDDAWGRLAGRLQCCGRAIILMWCHHFRRKETVAQIGEMVDLYIDLAAAAAPQALLVLCN